MENINKLKKMLCREMDEMGQRGELTAGELQTLSMLAGAYKNLLKIEGLEEGEGGESYGHYVRGHYSRADGSYRGNSYGGESYRNGPYSGRSYRASEYSGGDGMQTMDEVISQLVMRGKLNHEDERMLRDAMQMVNR